MYFGHIPDFFNYYPLLANKRDLEVGDIFYLLP